ncbi:hypothetical protein NLO88_10935 [Pseudomonas syringae]|uniref:hypothetical protein n=1 Tax=Pseudomonas TaxID=286 RepID=UPI000676A99C|nr:hypothetical protein [Pseudomonas quasicaspiana]MCQ2996578.1 hypothetical protein [Pseudomonas syringae]PHN16673.1 hypothetical protein AO242_06770 [Pseudomonas sp. ICMP 561]MCQ2999890.1 hypothetical protein [Pseudomonas syringae]MCQ3031174.1 hypothetical protein [Pseudomonas syringae]
MSVIRSVWAVLFSICLLGSSVAMAEEARPEVADKIFAYSGEKGVKVWVLRIGDRSANEALVQVAGVDHEWNLRIQKMKVENTNKDTRYSVQRDGKPYEVLRLDRDNGELYLPGESHELRVSYNDELSMTGRPQWFLTEFLDQK